MKKLYFILIVLFSILVSCSKDNNKPDKVVTPESPDTNNDTYKKILSLTGCKVKDPKSIIKYSPYKDEESHTTYVYGSRQINHKDAFWVSKYNQEGVLLWDMTVDSKDTEAETSHAYSFNRIDKDKIGLFHVSLKSYSLTSTNLMLIDANTGKLEKEIGFGKTTYSSMSNLKETILVYNTDHEINVTPIAGKKIIQITKTGEIINNEKEIKVIPSNEEIAVSNKSFLSIKPKLVIKNIFDETLWTAASESSVFKNQELNQDILTVIYENKFKLLDTLKYNVTTDKVVYESHNVPTTDLPNLIMAEVGKEYITADGLTVILNSFTSSKNGAGTAYYKISYTLKNNTPDKKILEGTFKLLYKNTEGSLQQNGFFNFILPGESVTNRTYEFKELEGVPMSLLQYAPAYNSDINNKNVHYWKVPAF